VREDIAVSRVVLYGKPTNRRVEMDGSESVEFVITSVLKSHPALNGRKVLRIRWSKELDLSPRILLCDEGRGVIEPFRGIAASPAALDYCKSLVTLDRKDTKERLRHYFNYLDHPDATVALDAFTELTRAPEVELGKVARGLPPQKLRRWIEDPAAPVQRLRLYGFLLGHCGDDTDAARLRHLAERLVKDEQSQPFGGVLTGYTLRAPKEGLAYLRALLGDPTKSYRVRYSCLLTLRYFHDARPDVIGERDVLSAMSLALQHADFADFPIEDLRKWKSWGLTREILALSNQPSFKDSPIIRRAIVRYALQCPRRQAANFAEAVRRADPEMVAELEEVLGLEQGK
jgi:hypothetical protein